ncbi:MAG: hypothetical protein Q8P50_03960 [Bacillota bacterium]|nr:hypothetical protein [Bacillota bacterium]
MNLTRLGNINPYIIYALMFFGILIPLITPLGFPVAVAQMVKNVYAAVDALQPGDTIVMSFDYSAGGSAEIFPQTRAMALQALKKNVKIVCIAFSDQGVPFADQIVDIYVSAGKKYGEDIVNLGYLTGAETGIAAFLADFAKAVPKDATGKDTLSFPLVKATNNANKVQLVGSFGTGKPGPLEWVRQLAQYKVKYAAGVTTSMAPQAYPYVQAGQCVGVLAGMVDAAGYEVLIKDPGPATKGMDAQSMGHLVMIVLVLLGNIAYWAERGQRGKGA